ncbi:hypothetical protein VULLAG_LOCUS21801 [Vulpes lagopus]
MSLRKVLRSQNEGQQAGHVSRRPPTRGSLRKTACEMQNLNPTPLPS